MLQVAGPLAIATLILTGIIWLTQALQMLDLVIAQGQTAITYLFLTALALPKVLETVMPLALFAATLYALHRLYTDSELVVLYSAGLSHWMIARPILLIAGVVSVIVISLNFYFMPAGLRELRTRIFDIRSDVAAVMIREGQFTTPVHGLTVFVRERSADGSINGILVHDNRTPEEPITYMAETGTLVNTDAGPRLVMFNGNIQRANKKPGEESLTLLYFDKYTYDLSQFTDQREEAYLEDRERYFHELIWPEPGDAYANTKPGELFAEANARLISPIYPFMFALLALAALVSAEFNRRGYARRIVLIVLIGTGVRVLALAIHNLMVTVPLAAVLAYLLPLATCGIAVAAIYGHTPYKVFWRLAALIGIRPPRSDLNLTQGA